jgi:hypothetical protein
MTQFRITIPVSFIDSLHTIFMTNIEALMLPQEEARSEDCNRLQHRASRRISIVKNVYQNTTMEHLVVLVSGFSETYIRQCDCLDAAVEKGVGDGRRYQGHLYCATATTVNPSVMLM